MWTIKAQCYLLEQQSHELYLKHTHKMKKKHRRRHNPNSIYPTHICACMQMYKYTYTNDRTEHTTHTQNKKTNRIEIVKTNHTQQILTRRGAATQSYSRNKMEVGTSRFYCISTVPILFTFSLYIHFHRSHCR